MLRTLYHSHPRYVKREPTYVPNNVIIFPNVLRPLNENRYVLVMLCFQRAPVAQELHCCHQLQHSRYSFNCKIEVRIGPSVYQNPHVCNQCVGLSASPGMLKWYVQVQIFGQVNLWKHTKVRKFSCK